jgi:hypothetical protein
MNIGLQALSVSEVSTTVKDQEVFMKLITALAMAIFMNGAFAISAYEKQNKLEMGERTDKLIEKVESARAHAKKEEAKEACAEIRSMLELYPDHLKSIGMKMNNYKTKVIVARDEALQQLIFIHRQSVVCEQGQNSEHVDSKDLAKKLKKISKSLKKQKKLIEKENTGYSNDFYYNYEF